MKETREYDIAARNFYGKQELNSLPLSSWDLFSSKFNTLCKGFDEIKVLRTIATSEKWADYSFFEKEILENEHIVVVTDTQLNIVHASDGIFEMNGYRPEEIMGKKPKMFQGEKTCKETAFTIRTAIRDQKPFEATVLNYRKDGSTYNCWIKGLPIRDKKGKVVNFIAFEREVA
ncbi:MAG: PAS domain-containing protein [Bacteroidota bacterium]